MNNLRRAIPRELIHNQFKLMSYISTMHYFGTRWYGIKDSSQSVVYNINNGFSNFINKNIHNTYLMENNFKKCVIDKKGDFKYIVIELTDINT